MGYFQKQKKLRQLAIDLLSAMGREDHYKNALTWKNPHHTAEELENMSCQLSVYHIVQIVSKLF